MINLIKKMLCEHKWKLQSWDEKVVPKETISRNCEFHFQCIKCETRKNVI